MCHKLFIPLIMALYSFNSFAVRPFVTDDARIISKGQIEIETWPELNTVGDEQTYAWQFMAGYSVNEWLELIVGSGLGVDRKEDRSTTANPVFSPKILFYKTELNSWVPGIALDLGVVANAGNGSLHDEATTTFGYFIASWRLFDDWINIHTNYGSRNANIDNRNYGREYWGIGFDIGIVNKDWRFIAEAFSGDPFEAEPPQNAYQWGGRWLKDDYLNFDLTFGTQPEMRNFTDKTDRQEYWVQFGVRILYDTKYATNPSYEGAEGLIKR